MNEIETADAAWQRHENIMFLRNQLETTFLQLGEELYWLAKERQYKVLGHDTFEAYLGDPDVDISRALAFRLKGVYERFILELESPAARLLDSGADKLDIIRPHVNEDNVDEWLDKATALSRSDLREEIRSEFDPPPPAPAGAALAEAKGNTIIIRCHNTRQANAIRSALDGLVEWR